MNKTLLKNYVMIFLGSLIFAASINLFIVPANLYNGGVVGIAQIIRTLLVEHFQLNVSFDIAGLINSLLNLPLFLLAFRSLSKKFFLMTLFSVAVQTFCFTLVPIPATPILPDVLSSTIIGGIVSGYGIALVLQQGACGGGTDIVGIYATMKSDRFSVGNISIIVNIFVYAFCAFSFDYVAAIYSIVYAVIFGISVDKFHLQNIAMNAIIITRNPEVKKMILNDMVRGVTYWHGKGAYTEMDNEVLTTVISKFEVNLLKRKVLGIDPQAFIIISEGMNVTGNYEKRLF